MLEIEIYASGIRDTQNIMNLGHAFETVEGIRYKVDGNHDIVYIEMDEPVMSLVELKDVFTRLSLEPCVVGSIPPELRPKTKTQLLKL